MDTRVKVQKRFDNFNARDYLEEYYSSVSDENREILAFLHQAYELIFHDLKTAKFLELGGGPTLYQLISASKFPITIHFSEHLDQNLSEVRYWMDNHPKKYSWSDFVSHTLQLENQTASKEAVENREKMIRNKTTKLLSCDLRKENPLGDEFEDFYDIVSMNFVAESITSDENEWKRFLKNAISLLRPGGYLVMCVIAGAKHYRVGGMHFPALPINENTVTLELANLGFEIKLRHSVDADSPDEQGYDGIKMFLAKRLTTY